MELSARSTGSSDVRVVAGNSRTKGADNRGSKIRCCRPNATSLHVGRRRIGSTAAVAVAPPSVTGTHPTGRVVRTEPDSDGAHDAHPGSRRRSAHPADG